jgi:hypothetical protein
MKAISNCAGRQKSSEPYPRELASGDQRLTRICLGRKKINFSTVLAGQAVGINEVHDDIWLVSFMDYDLGYFDLDTRVLEPLENPFGPKLLPMWPVRSVTNPCLRAGP